MDEETQAMINLGLHPLTAREFAISGVKARDIEPLINRCRETGEDPAPYIRTLIDMIHRLPFNPADWEAYPSDPNAIISRDK